MTEPSGDSIANPAPLGLMAFGMTTVLLNIHNAGFFEMNTMILAMGIFYGGIAQVIAGIMEFKKNNTFGATAFSSYGLFWLTLVALIVFPKWTGVEAASPEPAGVLRDVGVLPRRIPHVVKGLAVEDHDRHPMPPRPEHPQTRVERRVVEVGPLTAEGIEITSGLQDGDYVATAGLRTLTAGQQVKLLDQE